MSRKFIQQDPTASSYTPRLSETAWESQRALLSDLHAQGKSYTKMLEVLKSMDFHASRGQLRGRMDKWGFVEHRIEPNTSAAGVGQDTLSTSEDLMNIDGQDPSNQQIQEPPNSTLVSQWTLQIPDHHMSDEAQKLLLVILQKPMALKQKVLRLQQMATLDLHMGCFDMAFDLSCEIVSLLKDSAIEDDAYADTDTCFSTEQKYQQLCFAVSNCMCAAADSQRIRKAAFLFGQLGDLPQEYSAKGSTLARNRLEMAAQFLETGAGEPWNLNSFTPNALSSTGQCTMGSYFALLRKIPFSCHIWQCPTLKAAVRHTLDKIILNLSGTVHLATKLQSRFRNVDLSFCGSITATICFVLLENDGQFAASQEDFEATGKCDVCPPWELLGLASVALIFYLEHLIKERSFGGHNIGWHNIGWHKSGSDVSALEIYRAAECFIDDLDASSAAWNHFLLLSTRFQSLHLHLALKLKPLWREHVLAVTAMVSGLLDEQQVMDLGWFESHVEPVDKKATPLSSSHLAEIEIASVLPAIAKSYTSSMSSGFRSFKALSKRIAKFDTSSTYSVRSTGSGQFSGSDAFAPFATVPEEEARDENIQPPDVDMGEMEE